MNEQEMREHHGVLFRFIQREQRMRDRVLKGKTRERRLRECETALAALEAMKDALKTHLGPGPRQLALLDVPDQVKYE